MYFQIQTIFDDMGLNEVIIEKTEDIETTNTTTEKDLTSSPNLLVQGIDS